VVILLLSPRPDDLALSAFSAYLRARGVAHEFCSDLTALRFGVELERDGRTHIRLSLPEAGDVPASELGVLVHSSWGWQADDTRGEDRFVATEYHSALWTICALLPRVVNRPGRRAWLHERELRYALPASAFLAEHWTTDYGDLTERWKADGSAQAHVEDLVTAARWVVDTGRATPTHSPAPTQFRALFAPSSRYLIQVCVGRSAVTVLNEPAYDVERGTHPRSWSLWPESSRRTASTSTRW
jgi:hypothetical protein